MELKNPKAVHVGRVLVFLKASTVPASFKIILNLARGRVSKDYGEDSKYKSDYIF
jgi:hypothetical protein